MIRRTAPITDPRHIARTRLASGAMIACVTMAYAIILLCFFNPASTALRIYAPLPFAFCFYIIHALLIRSFRLPKNEIPLLPDPHPLIFFVCFALVTVSPFVAIVAHPFLPGRAYIGMIGLPLIAAGLAATFYALLGSRAGVPACPRCAYALAGLELPGPCPECAHPLTPPDATRAGAVRVTRTPVLWAGVGVLAAGILAIFLILNAPAALYRALPDPLHRLLASIDADALAALNTAALSPAQRAALADRILRERATREDPIEIMHQIDWLATEIAAGNLDPSFTDRYALEGFTLRIINDAPIRADEPFRISVAGTQLFYSAFGVDVRYFFAGFEIDGSGPIAREARDFPFYAFDTTLEQRDRGADRNRASNLTPLPYPTHTLTPTLEAPTRVRARIVVCVLPQPWTAAPAITWHDDGSYTITPTPLHTTELIAETTLQRPR